MEKVSTYCFTVEPFYVDFTGRLFLSVLGNHLLNAAGNHSHDRGWGIDQLNEVHYTWVLSRMCIELYDMPRQYEHVEIETWVESVMKLFTERNFLIRNADNGHVYGYARSVWAMIDTSTRRPANLLTLHDGDILRYVLSAEEKPCPIERFKAVSPLTPDQQPDTIPLDPKYSDIDINGHVNSVKYIEHILDIFPVQTFETHQISRFDIAYKTEAFVTDPLQLLCKNADGEYHLEFRKNVGSGKRPDGELVAQARIIWKEQ
ncbi:MAG: acyl-[acyl-carrier-protein] thioesterase [Bacteroidaceae bacterium]|nr:acyl-[acyl-carrier-protein] thioesterase [Bacteroidaceae bacterium]